MKGKIQDVFVKQNIVSSLCVSTEHRSSLHIILAHMRAGLEVSISTL